ncbi:iduronate 2-sulfatase [Anseongella ginsenosidimutans]|uniref:Iduronate 2-sulfatase n=1 Tax=Anseongella ginsenosidimutans TaxID=496056 RepID=A0A4R3KPR8_9SPHI|nr:sulfatase [Anseongella ginsenosidimutans]TCS85872.1 iduronate 2-sulfatase [Anseongella ginsenosidimutans]
MKLLVLSGVFVLLAFTSCGQEQPPARPNVLFIAVDDLRVQLGCYGDPVAVTPNINRLAAKGMVFNRAYCQQAVCNPSRASLMTGRRPNTTRVWNLSTHFREALPQVVTLPQYFKQNGYHTRAIGKIYHDPAWAKDSVSWSAPEILAVTGTKGKYTLDSNLNKKGSWKAGATERANVEDEAYIDGKVSQAAVELLSEIKDEPFFLAVGFRRPHLPFSAPEPYWELYDPAALPLPKFRQAPANAPELALHHSDELRGYRDIPDEGPLPEEKVRELIHGYYAATSYIDAQIGNVIRELERLGLRENTIIVLWSDHGFHLGEHGLWSKTTNFELDTRVPLIISAPGQEATGVRSDALVELVDLYPTLAELAGLTLPAGLEGTSMKPLLADPDQPWKTAAFSQFPRPWRYKKQPAIMGYSLRTADYRYTEWQDFETGEVEARELYDHRKDPLETENIAGKNEQAKNIELLSQMLKEGWQGAVPEVK